MWRYIRKNIIENPMVIIFFGFITIIFLITYISVKIGGAYQEYIDVNEPIIEHKEERFLRIRKIRIRKEKDDSAECYELSNNGLLRIYDCDSGRILDERLLGFEQVTGIFGKLSLDDFDSLASLYSGGDSTYTITIETNQGTKTVTINPGDGGGTVPEGIEDIIDEIEEEVGPTPTPSSSATPQPTSTSTPISSATPSPSPITSPTPTPTSQPGATVEPFSCDMISGYDRPIIVSNEACLP